MSPEATEVIAALAKISTPAWEAFVWQTRMYGILAIVFSGLLFIISASCFRHASTLPVKDSHDDEFSEREGFTIAAVVCFFLMVILFFSGIFRLINPVYYAVQSLVGR